MTTLSLPNTREPFLDPRTGAITKIWWRFLNDLMDRVGGASGSDLSAIITLLAEAITEIDELQTEYTPQPVGIQDALRMAEELRIELESTRRAVDEQRQMMESLRSELESARGGANEQRQMIEELRSQIEHSRTNDLLSRIESIEGRLS